MNYSFNPKVRAISHVSFLFVWHKKLPAIFATLGNLIMGARQLRMFIKCIFCFVAS